MSHVDLRRRDRIPHALLHLPMTWRELWQSAVANVRALFSAPPPPPPPSVLRVAPPRALPGPVQTRHLATPDAHPLDAAAPEPTPAPAQTLPAPAQAMAAADDDPPPDELSDVELGDDDRDEPAPDGDPNPDLDLLALVESLLFVAAEPVDPAQLAQTLEVDAETISALLAHLDAAYRTPGRGLRLQTLGGKVQLVSAPEAAAAIEHFLNLDSSARLSGPALETLAVIAYRQPVTRAQIEAVRGVDCAGVLRSLTQRGLINEVGRQETVGRPILYGVTELFLQHFGLLGLGDLPPLEESEADRLHAAVAPADEATDS